MRIWIDLISPLFEDKMKAVRVDVECWGKDSFSVSSLLNWVAWDSSISFFLIFTQSIWNKEYCQKGYTTRSSIFMAHNSFKNFHSTVEFNRPADENSYYISILLFSDAIRNVGYGQLVTVEGLFIGETDSGSINHTLSWCSHNCMRPVKSIGAAWAIATE